MAKVTLEKEGSFEKMMKKFKRRVQEDGIMKEIKKRMAYESPSLKRKTKSKEAEKRRRSIEAKRARYINKFGE